MRKIISVHPSFILVVECKRLDRERTRTLYLTFGELRRIKENRPEQFIKSVKPYGKVHLDA